MIHYISPYSISKNIGKAINEAISQLSAPDEHWICLTDMDVLWLRSDSKKQLEEILHTTKFDLLGPATNRLAQHYQLVETFDGQNVFNNSDIHFHIRIANNLHKANYGKVYPTQSILAAFCLCFKVKTWKQLGGFAENSLQFDSQLCMRAMKCKLKLGIMTGIYLFHLYRMWSDNPKVDIKHLLPNQDFDSDQE